MNTHILSDVEMICDRVAIIVNGRIAYEGALEAFHGERKLLRRDAVLACRPTSPRRSSRGSSARSPAAASA